MDSYWDVPPVLEDFLNYLTTVKGLSQQTVQEYYYDLRRFLRYMEYRKHRGKWKDTEIDEIEIIEYDENDLKDIDIRDLQAYLAFSDREYQDTTSTRARKVSSLRSFFKYLTDTLEFLEVNPATKLTTPKQKTRYPVYLTLQEALHLIETVQEEKNEFFRKRDLAIIVTFLTCGLRLSELSGMNLGSIKDNCFRVIGKGNKERIVYMTDACAMLIEDYLTVRPKVEGENALFLSSRKQRMSNRAIQHMIKKYLQKAGFDTEVYSTHKLRHTAATLMYKEGVDIRTLQKILGHSSVSTTQIYTHVEDEDMRAAIEKNPLSNL